MVDANLFYFEMLNRQMSLDLVDVCRVPSLVKDCWYDQQGEELPHYKVPGDSHAIQLSLSVLREGCWGDTMLLQALSPNKGIGVCSTHAQRLQ